MGPSWEQFAAMLSSSPQLECLDIGGFCPEHHTGPAPLAGGDPEIPVVHLPALKEFVFGWKDIDSSWTPNPAWGAGRTKRQETGFGDTNRAESSGP